MRLLRLPTVPAMIGLAAATALLPLSVDAEESTRRSDGALFSRSFVDQSQVISNYQAEQYAHQSSMRIVKGIGYVVYQCNEKTPEENKEGQVARMAIFQILNPMATARWLDISGPGDASGGLEITGRFVAGPMLHQIDDDTLRIFFTSRLQGDTSPSARVFFKDYQISTARLGELRQARCTIAGQASPVADLDTNAIQRHLDFLFGPGFGASFSSGLSTTCDYIALDGQLYSTIQI